MVINGTASEYEIPPISKITDANSSGHIPVSPITDSGDVWPHLTAQHEYRRGFVDGVKVGRDLELEDVIACIKEHMYDKALIDASNEICTASIFQAVNAKLDEIIMFLKEGK